MEDQELNKIVEELYYCRLQNDADKCLAYFSSEGVLRLAGIPQDPTSSCSDVLHELVAVWSFDHIENLEMLVEGRKVATRYRLDATFNPSNEKVSVEVADWITFDEGNQVVELVQHLDTALLLKVSGQLT